MISKGVSSQESFLSRNHTPLFLKSHNLDQKVFCNEMIILKNYYHIHFKL